MISLNITEHINGFSVVLYDWKTGKKVLDEIHEEKVTALRAVRNWVNDELREEFNRRISNASIL